MVWRSLYKLVWGEKMENCHCSEIRNAQQIWEINIDCQSTAHKKFTLFTQDGIMSFKFQILITNRKVQMTVLEIALKCTSQIPLIGHFHFGDSFIVENLRWLFVKLMEMLNLKYKVSDSFLCVYY